MKEALKLALEALEQFRECDDPQLEDWELAHKAIAAIKEVLAQPAQEPDELTIAYMSGLYDGKKKRPWVGLTEEERQECVNTPFVAEQWANIEAKLKEKNFD
jgi:hypothetical protein